MRFNLPFLLDALVVTLIVLAIGTQIIIPLWRGLSLFPAFDWRRKAALRANAEARDQLAAESIEQETTNLMKKDQP